LDKDDKSNEIIFNYKKIYIIFLLALFLNACATPHVVSVIGPSDNSMSCSQLDSEIAIASNYKRDAKSEKSYGTATNVGAILFWLPGVVATQMNANDAIRAADERINHLTRLKAKKNC